jgi:hypothetical protein
MWTLTYSLEGAKQVVVVPTALVSKLQPLADEGRLWRDALADLLVINAQLVGLWRREQRRRTARRRPAKHRD